jgi:hypothetical protein
MEDEKTMSKKSNKTWIMAGICAVSFICGSKWCGYKISRGFEVLFKENEGLEQSLRDAMANHYKILFSKK